ncbi:MAG: adenine deaminase [Conexivisphaerales archaeon]
MSALSDFIDASIGRRELSLLLTNCRLLNVYTGEVYPTSIGIYGEKIVIVDENATKRRAEKVIDAKGMIAIPGFIDTHLHVESSMVTPYRFAEAVLPHGTTTAFADPHEIANVLGKEGVRMMVENAKGLPMKLMFFAPTCVPESKAVTAGAELSPSDIEEMLQWEGICGLGEVMDFPAVLAGSSKMMQILEIGRKRNAVIDGHSPLLSGAELNAYITSGAEADHENFTVETTLEKMRLGMYVKLRGPYLLDTSKFVSAIEKLPKPWNLIFCTDDVMPDNLVRWGHLDYIVRSFIKAGMDPVEAIRSVTIRPAQHMRAYDLGAIAPGKTADILLVDDFENFRVQKVISSGKLVAESGRLVINIEERRFNEKALSTVKVKKVSMDDMKIDFGIRDGEVTVNAIDFTRYSRAEESNFLDIALTKLNRARLRVKHGQPELGEVALVFVFERHGKSSSRSFGFARNLIRRGAIASTIAHDAHNLIVVGTDIQDMVRAANLVIESQGGLSAVLDGNVLAHIKLPVAGLMSEMPLAIVAAEMRNLRAAFEKMGVLDHPYMPLPCLLTLSVIPHARITDKGIFDVDEQSFVYPFVAEA